MNQTQENNVYIILANFVGEEKEEKIGICSCSDLTEALLALRFWENQKEFCNLEIKSKNGSI